jgi:hypothetical protein
MEVFLARVFNNKLRIDSINHIIFVIFFVKYIGSRWQ